MSLPRFGVTRPVPVNLLMFAFLIAGLVSAATLTREFFPETNPESASITLIYPGATPREVEESLARKVEDAVAELDEVDRVTTSLNEGGGSIFVEFRDGENVKNATDEVERVVEALRDLPDEAEEIEVREVDPTLQVIMLSLFGEADEEVLKRAIRRMREDLQSISGMGDVSMSGVREYEIRVDVRQESLLEHQISLPEVAASIRAWMSDVPGGSIRTNVGSISVRTIGVEERAEAIRDIVVKGTTDGGVLRVRDIADVVEGYVDESLTTRFATRDMGGPAVSLTVFKVGDQDAVEIAEIVRAYVAGRRGDPFETKPVDRLFGLLSSSAPPDRAMKSARREAYELGLNAPEPLPEGCDLQAHSDLAVFIEGRLDLLVRNAKWGALLVFATVLLFLNWRVAFWVGMGLATALCGTLLVMKIVGITLNMLTMFGLIIVMGLLVDDAIVVAENIQARHDRKEPALVSAIKGTEQVFWPVVATVMTSIVAFLPLTFVKGVIGDLLGALPYVVACALLMSLVESVLILPSHMGHSLKHRDRSEPGPVGRRLRAVETWRDRIIMHRIVPAFGRLLAFALRFRYASVAISLAILIGSIGMIAGGRLPFEFLPASDSETIMVDVRMPIGSPTESTEEIAKLIEDAARAQPEVRSMSTYLGVLIDVGDATGVTSAGSGDHLAQIFVELLSVEERDRESSEVIASMREMVGSPVGVDRIAFSEIQGGPGGADITFEVYGEDETRMAAAAADIEALLASRKGVVDIANDNYAGQRELQFRLKAGAATLGFTNDIVAQQVRAALFGIDAHVFSQKREDIDVRVRLAEDDRERLATIENIWLIAPGGQRVPVTEVADISEGVGYSTIRRVDRRRAITITAETVPEANPEEIMGALRPEVAALRAKYPDLTLETGGRQRQLAKAFSSLPVGFLAACVMIYTILAWLFSSYLQPLAVMMAVPFASIGVVWGHLLMGYQLTFLSLIGAVALSGIVVNDSLILIQFYNEKREAGTSVADALVAAGRERLRPIFLTTVTTVLGLTPLMLEQSFQAKFLIPMAVSIAFGLMSATVLILLTLPCIILIMDDLRRLCYYLWHGRPRDVESRPIPGLEG